MTVPAGGSLRLGIDSSEAATGSRIYARSIDEIKAKSAEGVAAVNKVPASFEAMRNAVAQGVKGLGLALGVRELASYTDQWKTLTSQLRLVTHGESELVETQRELLGLAQETRTSIAATTNLYTRLARSTEQVGISGTELLGVTRTVNQAMLVGGSTAASAEAAIIQFGQALGAGALRGDELRSVLEQAPGLAKTLAAGLGVAQGQLKSLGEAGALTTEKVVAALQNQAQAVETEYSKMGLRIGDAFTQAKNSVLAYVGGVDQAVGAGAAIATVISTIAGNVDLLGAALGTAGVIWLSRLVGPIVQGAAQSIAATTQMYAAVARGDAVMLSGATATAQRAAAARDAAIALEAEAAATTRAAAAALEQARAQAIAIAQERSSGVRTIAPDVNAAASAAMIRREAEARLVAAQATAAQVAEEVALAEVRTRNATVVANSALRESAAANVRQAALIELTTEETNLALVEARAIGVRAELEAATIALTAAELRQAEVSAVRTIAAREDVTLRAAEAAALRNLTIAKGELVAAEAAQAVAASGSAVATVAATEATVALSVGSRIAAAGTAALSGAMTLLGGPVGVAIAGGMALYAVYRSLANNAKEQQAAQEALLSSVAEGSRWSSVYQAQLDAEAKAHGRVAAAVTDEAKKKLAEVNDARARLTAAGGGGGSASFTGAASAQSIEIAQLVNAFKSGTMEADAFRARLVALGAAFPNMRPRVAEILDAAQAYGIATGKINSTTDATNRLTVATNRLTGAQSQALMGLVDQVQEAGKLAAALDKGGLKGLESERTRQKVVADGSKAWGEYVDKQSDATLKQLSYTEALKKGEPAAKAINALLTDRQSILDRVKTREDALEKSTKDGTKTLTERNKALAQLNATMAEKALVEEFFSPAQTEQLGRALEDLHAKLRYQQELLTQTADAHGKNKAAIEAEITAQYKADQALTKSRRLQEQYAAWKASQLATEARLRDSFSVNTIISVGGDGNSQSPGTLATASTDRESYKEAGRAIQQAVARAVETGLTQGVDAGIDALKGAFMTAFTNMFAASIQQSLASSAVADAFKKGIANGSGGLTQAAFQLTGNKNLSKGIGYLGAATAGFGLGKSTGNAAIGAISGAAAGNALAGPVGAVLGGIGGLVGGLFGHAAKAREAAKQLLDAQKAFQLVLDAYVANANGTATELSNAVAANTAKRKQLEDAARDLLQSEMKAALQARDTDAAERAGQKYADTLKEIATASGLTVAQLQQEAAERQRRVTEDLVMQGLTAKAMGTTGAEALARQREIEDRQLAVTQIRAQVDARVNGWTEEQQAMLLQNQAEEVLGLARRRAAEDADAAAEAEKKRADIAKASAQVVEDNAVRILRAQGKGEEADAMARSLEHGRIVAQQLADGLSAEAIASENAAHAAEELAIGLQRQADLTAEAAKRVAEGKDFMLDLAEREAARSGDEAQIHTARLARMEAEQEAARKHARDLVNSGAITQAAFDRFDSLLRNEYIDALTDTSEAAALAAQKMQDAVASLNQEFDVFELDLAAQAKAMGSQFGFDGKSIADLQDQYLTLAEREGRELTSGEKATNDNIATYLRLAFRQRDEATGPGEVERTGSSIRQGSTAPSGNVYNGPVRIEVTLQVPVHELANGAVFAEKFAEKTAQLLGGRARIVKAGAGQI